MIARNGAPMNSTMSEMLSPDTEEKWATRRALKALPRRVIG